MIFWKPLEYRKLVHLRHAIWSNNHFGLSIWIIFRFYSLLIIGFGAVLLLAFWILNVPRQIVDLVSTGIGLGIIYLFLKEIGFTIRLQNMNYVEISSELALAKSNLGMT